MPSLPAGPTGDGYTNSTGDTTITPTSQNYMADVTFTGLARTSNLIIGTPGLDTGSRINVLCIFDGVADSLVLNIKNVNGTNLFTFTKAGGEANGLFVIEGRGWGGLRPVSATVPAFG